MEVELVENVPTLDRSNVLLQYSDRLEVLKELASESLDEKLASSKSMDNRQLENRLVELGLYDNQSEDEGEIMLLAMILLQLHGVKLPMSAQELVDNEDSNINKKKRQRTSPEQLAILEQIFQTDKMPNQQTRVQLADQLGMSSRRVQIWFQNKRAKVKRNMMKSEQPNGSPLNGTVPDRQNTPSSPSSCSSPSSPVPIASPEDPPTPTRQGQVPNMPKKHQATTPLNNGKPNKDIKAQLPSPTTTAALSSSQLQFSLTSFDSQPLLLPNEYNTMRLNSMLKSSQ